MYIPDLNFFSDPDQYPDLLNIHPKHPSSPKVGQPLNPAALVMPPTPPAQFPHQFQVHKIFFPPFYSQWGQNHYECEFCVRWHEIKYSKMVKIKNHKTKVTKIPKPKDKKIWDERNI